MKKTINLTDCKLKFDEPERGTFSGYASVFGGVDSYNDTIIKGAYTESLEKLMPKMFVNHDSRDVPVGDWLEAKEDEHGLFVSGKIDMNHRDGLTVYSALKRGAMDGISIGYTIPEGGRKRREDGVTELSKIDLSEMSIVSFPADDAARVGAVKSDIEKIDSLKEVESFLRDEANLSNSTAKTFISRFKSILQRDAGKDINERKARNESLLNILNKY